MSKRDNLDTSRTEETPEHLVRHLPMFTSVFLRYWPSAKPIAWGPSEFPTPPGQGVPPPYNPRKNISDIPDSVFGHSAKWFRILRAATKF